MLGQKPRFRVAEPIRRMHSDRVPYLMLDKGVLRVDGHALLLVQEDGNIEIPASLVSCLMLGPGLSVSHEAVKLAAENGMLLLWVGEGCTRLYAVANSQHKSERILAQASIHSDMKRRIQAAGRLYALMFGEHMPPSFTIDKLRGIEGAKVRGIYQSLAQEHGIEWTGRAAKTILNDCIGYATSCLYAASEVAILAAGYSAAIGVVHSGDPRSLVFDLADTVKFSTVVPLAFKVAAESPPNVNMAIRHACRDLFLADHIVEKLFGNLEKIFGESQCI